MTDKQQDLYQQEKWDRGRKRGREGEKEGEGGGEEGERGGRTRQGAREREPDRRKYLGKYPGENARLARKRAGYRSAHARPRHYELSIRRSGARHHLLL